MLTHRPRFLVAFSCKGRGVCPSCNTRRMAETAAHLVEQVTVTPHELQIKLRPTRIEKLALEFGATEPPPAMEAAA